MIGKKVPSVVIGQVIGVAPAICQRPMQGAHVFQFPAQEVPHYSMKAHVTSTQVEVDQQGKSVQVPAQLFTVEFVHSTSSAPKPLDCREWHVGVVTEDC